MKNKKILSIVSIFCAFIIIIGGALAFFSDSAILNENINVGTFDIDVTGGLFHSNGLNNLNPGDNDPAIPNQSRPGTDHELSFNIENLGNKSAITRTVIEISGIKNDGTPLTEEELMNIIISEKANVTEMTTQGTIANTDINKQTEVNKLTATGFSYNKLVYIVGGNRIPQDVLNGIGDNAEIETGITKSNLIKTFDIGLDMNSDSETYAGSTITIKIRFEAMQYRNTMDSTWTNIFEQTFTTAGTPLAPKKVLIKGKDFNDAIPANTKTIIFTDEVAPAGTSLRDLSVEQDGSIVGWKDDSTYKISSQEKNVKITANKDCSGMFWWHYTGTPLYYVETIDLTNLDTSITTNMSDMFSYSAHLKNIIFSDGFKTSKVTNMSNMFSYCESLEEINFPSTFDTANVKTMRQMFAGCKNLKTIDVSNFNTNKTEDMSFLFNHCESLTTIDISNFNTSNVDNMNNMFSYCSSVTDIILPNNFDTPKVTTMGQMFSDCNKITTIDLSKFNTNNVKYMNYMFKNCPSLTTLDFSTFNISNVVDMHGMFEGSNWNKLIFPDTFDTSNANVEDMFRNYKGNGTLIVGSNFKFTGKGTYNDASYPYGSGTWTDGTKQYNYNKLPDNTPNTYTVVR